MTKPSPWWRRLLALAELAGDLEQKDIANRLGVSPAAVSDWKNRGTELDPNQLRKAARAYSAFTEADTDQLFRNSKTSLTRSTRLSP
jgi:transcriptional regulator with XRE-family HTH domain